MPVFFASIGIIRGALLEEVVLFLLKKVGYRIVNPGEEGTRDSAAGLVLRGRGTGHQIDALAAYDHSPAFIYPLRLLVEAKCYAFGRKVDLPIVRNTVGVLKDIAENYVSQGGNSPAMSRFNYVSSVFSTSGYTREAQHYAVAHQVYLIQYHERSLLRDTVTGLLALRPSHFGIRSTLLNAGQIKRIRRAFRSMLEQAPLEPEDEVPGLSQEGMHHLLIEVIAPLHRIRGSYYGSLQGRWPMHLLSRTVIPARAFHGTDTLDCRIRRRVDGQWYFTPSQPGPGHTFELEFDLPSEVARLVDAVQDDALRLAQIKAREFSFIDLTGVIGGVRRQVRLELDRHWLDEYLRGRGYQDGLETDQ